MTTAPPSIRELTPAELELANAIYDELDFVRSTRPPHRTFGSFDGDRLVALGRLADFDDGGVELGGLWTHPSARHRGRARAMVRFALERAPTDRACYLLAFAHLTGLYRSCGFTDLPGGHEPPPSIVAKRSTCARREQEGRHGPTVLLCRERRGSTGS